MRFGRAILNLLLVTAFAAYVVDCSGMTTPEGAMKCCESLSCSSSGHSLDCCQAMLQMHAPFVQPVSAHRFSFAPDLTAIFSIPCRAAQSDSRLLRIASPLLAPPGASPPIAAPIRI